MLDEQRVLFGNMFQQADGSIAIPTREGVGFVRGFRMRKLKLQDNLFLPPYRRDDA